MSGSPNRLVAGVFGAVYLLVGLLGFAVTGFSDFAGTDTGDNLLEPGATPQQLREAYRDLVRVWHPDRFEADERLRHKAGSRLSEINAAYRFLSSTQTARMAERARAARTSSRSPAFSAG